MPQGDGSVKIDGLVVYPATKAFDILAAKYAADNEAGWPGAKRSPKRSKYIMLSSNSICLFLFLFFMLIDAPLTETEITETEKDAPSETLLIDAPLTETEKDVPSETLEDRSEAIN